jgi:hypothetical protein
MAGVAVSDSAQMLKRLVGAPHALFLPILAAGFAMVALGVLDAGAQPLERAAAAPTGQREQLNSERIAQRFGSYGITVLESDARVRVSNLYSEESAGRICRTFAVVKYPDAIDPAFAAEHAEIVRGGSLGAVFAAHGWKVGKSNLEIFEIDATARVAELMGVAQGTPLAAHAYVLDVSKGGAPIEYALLVEIHHPGYLTAQELHAIYGGASARGREASLAALRATVLEKTAR